MSLAASESMVNCYFFFYLKSLGSVNQKTNQISSVKNSVGTKVISINGKAIPVKILKMIPRAELMANSGLSSSKSFPENNLNKGTQKVQSISSKKIVFSFGKNDHDETASRSGSKTLDLNNIPKVNGDKGIF